VATVLLPRSLLALFPGVERRHDVAPGTVGTALEELERSVPGLRDRLVEPGPRLRPHINVFVDGQPGDLASPVETGSTIHVIPAVSGGARRRT
jgi:sulfur-carrier protein